MKKTIPRKLGDIAMIAALPDYAAGADEQKIQYLFGRLRKRVDTQLKKLNVSALDRVMARTRADEFEKVTGWKDDKRMHIGTYISFALCITEEYDGDAFSAIADTLSRIQGLFEGMGEWKEACNWAGELAYDRWVEVWA